MLALDATELVSTNRDDIAAAIKVIRPQGPLLLVAIDPQGVRQPVGRTFVMPEALEAAVAWSVEQNEGGWNCYFTPNVSKASVHKKAAKGDMTDGLMVWTDADPNILAFRGYAAARDHLLRNVFPDLERSASIIIDSGNGLQGFWRLKGAVNLVDLERREHYEQLNGRVGDLFDGPGTQNCDRVMRLPGTINYPTKSKLAKGYPAEPRQARLLYSSDRSYTLGELEDLLLRRRFDVFLDGHQHARMRYDGHADGLVDPSGSGRDMSMVRMMKAAGFQLREIVALLENWPHGSLQGRAQGFRYWQRMWDKPKDDSEPRQTDPPPKTAPSDGTDRRLRPVTLDELFAQPAPGWLIRNVLIKTGLALIYGPPGSGKSFLALDLCGCILRGIPWYGHRVSRGNVIYIAGEGHLRNRLRAYLLQHGLQPSDLVGLRIVNAGLNLRNPKADLLPLLRELQEAAIAMGGVSLVVIDTLNSVMGAGDENESSDMGAMIEAARKIGAATGSTVMYVHHSGKDEERGARGHSSLKGALDTEICVTRTDDRRSLKLTKVKEGEDGIELAFSLQTIDLGPSTDPEASPDERETSCAVIQITDQPSTDQPKRPKGRPTNGSTLLALDALRAVLSDHGQLLPTTSVIPSGKRGVKVETWRDRFYATDPGCGDAEVSRDAKRKRFQRSFDELYKAGAIGTASQFVWLER